jgi:hypothetical protein
MCPEVDSASWKWAPGIYPGVKAAGAFGWRPTTLVVPKVEKIRGVNLPGTPRATSACRGIPLLYLIWKACEWEDWGKAKAAAVWVSGLGLTYESCTTPRPEVWKRPSRKTISEWQEYYLCSQRLQQVKFGQCANSSWQHELFCRPSLLRYDWCENLQWQKNVLLKTTHYLNHNLLSVLVVKTSFDLSAAQVLSDKCSNTAVHLFAIL